MNGFYTVRPINSMKYSQCLLNEYFFTAIVRDSDDDFTLIATTSRKCKTAKMTQIREEFDAKLAGLGVTSEMLQIPM